MPRVPAPFAATACAKCGTPFPPVAKLCPECPNAVAAQPALTVTAERPPTRSPDAERRQLTVIFCDLLGPTALTARLDLEDLWGVIRAYQAALSRGDRRFDGHIVQYLGNGLFVYLGYPYVHEGDPGRAARSALGTIAAIDGSKARLPEPLAVRIGILTGPAHQNWVTGGAQLEIY